MKHNRNNRNIVILIVILSVVILVSGSTSSGKSVVPDNPEAGIVTGVVRDAVDNRPLPGVIVSVGNISDTTGPDGSFVISRILKGKAIITTILDGYKNHSKSVSIAANEISPVEIRLKRVTSSSGTVKGTILRADGVSPCGGALVSINGLSAYSGIDGNYIINGIESGVQGITVTKPPYPVFYGNILVKKGSVKHNVALRVNASTAVGGFHTLSLKEDGTVWAWGRNTAGQLGDDTTTQRSIPVQVVQDSKKVLTNIVAVAAGENHSVVLKDDGTVWAWGDNAAGQLGDGNTTDSRTPVQVPMLSNVVSIAAGQMYTVALKDDGTLWTWGMNDEGQLGDGTTSVRLLPVQVNNAEDKTGPLTGVIAVSAGNSHTVALMQDGTVWAWGDNWAGQLGNGTKFDSKIPVQAKNLSNITAIAAGGKHTLAIRKDGTAWAWGANWTGQLGDGSTTNRYIPAQVINLANITAIAAGNYHNVALRENGTVWAWGYNRYGQLGVGNREPINIPVQVRDLKHKEGLLKDVTSISTGYAHMTALKTDGTVLSWGYNYYGQLGCNTNEECYSLPVRLSVINLKE